MRKNRKHLYLSELIYISRKIHCNGNITVCIKFNSRRDLNHFMNKVHYAVTEECNQVPTVRTTLVGKIFFQAANFTEVVPKNTPCFHWGKRNSSEKKETFFLQFILKAVFLTNGGQHTEDVTNQHHYASGIVNTRDETDSFEQLRTLWNYLTIFNFKYT